MTCAHMGASVWLLVPRRDRFSSPRGVFALRVDVFVPRREECLSLARWCCRTHFSCRAFSPACHRRGRRHRGGCASFTVKPWSISLTCPLHSFKRICLRVSSFHKNVLPCALSSKSRTNHRKHQPKLSFRRACCNAQWSRSCTCPFHSSWK